MVAIAKKKKGCLYVRRSTQDQANSLVTQLDWALGKSMEYGVELDASQDDLSLALDGRYSHYKSMFIDDGISGTKRDREGLAKLQSVLRSDTSFTHLFVHRSDRLGRDDALVITSLESEIRKLGITIVYNDRDKKPLGRDGAEMGDVISSILDHASSRQWLEGHSERVVESQIRAALKGYWAGGTPPYGFKRVLVGPDGNIIEALRTGRRVKEDGCHVEIVPGDEKEIKVLRMIFSWMDQNMGVKTIANRLNEMGIPSPAAGKKRKDNNTTHFVSGGWSHTTVRDLASNRKLMGLLDFGRRSEGIVRRASPKGPRKLQDTDYSPSAKPKRVRNETSQIISVPGKYEPPISEDVFLRVNEQLELRGKSQRGIPKNSDPSKNLLACRIIDLQDGCGHPMYVKGAADGRCYACGRYMKTSGKECRHNKIDADEVERLSLEAIRQLVLNQVGRLGFAEMLKKVANERRSQHDHENSIEKYSRDLEAIERKIGRVKSQVVDEEDDELRIEYQKKYKELKIERSQLKAMVESIPQKQNAIAQEASDVQKCMMLLDNLDLILSHPEARKRLNSFFLRLNVRLGIDFETQVKGKKREVQVPTSGLLRFNDEKLPVPNYGKDNAEN